MKLLIKGIVTHSDKIALTAAWLATTATTLIERHVWKPAEAVWFLFMIYHIALFLELYWFYKGSQLTWRLVRAKVFTVTSSLFGAVLLLFVATGVARYSVVFFWMPPAIMALLLAATLLSIIRYASKLEIISKQIAQFLESKINDSTNKLKNDDFSDPTPTSPAETMEQASTIES